jgi:hypothetical protein
MQRPQTMACMQVRSEDEKSNHAWMTPLTLVKRYLRGVLTICTDLGFLNKRGARDHDEDFPRSQAHFR